MNISLTKINLDRNIGQHDWKNRTIRYSSETNAISQQNQMKLDNFGMFLLLKYLIKKWNFMKPKSDWYINRWNQMSFETFSF